MIRVCEVITRLIVGGAQETAVLTCARLDPDAFEAALVAGPQTGPEGSLHDWARELGVRLDVEPSLVRELAPWSDLRALYRLWRRFRREHPDVVHTHSSKAGILGRLAARLAGVPAVVHTVHGWSFHAHMPRWERSTYVRLERLAARWTDRFVLVTDRDRAKGLSVGIGRPERYVTIRSGVDLAPYRTGDGDAVRADLGIPHGAPVVGTVARLSPQKDPIGFVEAGAEVLEKRPEAHLVFAGDGPMRPEVERRAAELGVADRLHLPGIRRDVPDVVAAFDVFVASSLWEGLPRTVIQAMASGVPVVASAVDGIAEAVRDGESGLLVPPGDRRALAEAILRLLDDRDLAGRLADGGRSRAEDFGEEAMVGELAGLYRGLVGSTAPAGSVAPRLRRAARRLRTRTAPYRALPDFVIIGAQRSGTTSLYDYLVRHPDVRPAVRKEVHFFDLDHERGLDWYRSHFPLRVSMALQRALLRRRVVTGEATPYYLFHPLVPGRVREVLPDARFVVLLRDPVERAYSQYRRQVRLGREPEDFEAALAAEADRLAGEDERIRRGEPRQHPPHQVYSYFARGLYAEQLERWFAHFPRDRFLVLRSDDLFREPAATYARVLDFLGLRSHDPGPFDVHAPGDGSSMPDDARERLRKRYAEADEALYRLVGIDFRAGGRP